MIDTAEIRHKVDLLGLVGGDLRKVASTGGGEFAGPCPFCGGKDRFRVQPHHESGGRWFCRQCGGERWHDAIDFVQRRDRLTFTDAARLLVGDELPTVTDFTPRPTAPAPLDAPPEHDWQTAAVTAVSDSIHCLLSGETDAARGAWHYLRTHRGLTPDTIKAAGIGFNPRGRRVGGFWLEEGITIPILVGGDFWAVNVRTTKAAQRNGRPKYMAMAGSVKRALYRANTLDSATVAVICEGEFDALLLSQYLPSGWAAVAAGGATMPPRRWLLHLAHCTRVLLAFDNDEEGRRGSAQWRDHLPRADVLRIPDPHNDITDFWAAGGNLEGLTRDS